MNALRAYRDANRISQQELAGRLKVSRMTLLRWENGKRAINPDKLAEISKETGIPKRELRPDLATLMDAAE